MFFEEILKKISEPADVSVFLLSFSIGFIFDAIYFNGGVPSGTVAGVLAIGCLGIKKGIDASLLGSTHAAEKLTRKRLTKLRQYFSDNQKATQVVDTLGKMLDAKLIDCNSFNILLNEQLQSYIDYNLKDRQLAEIDRANDMYQSLYKDFKKFHSLLKPSEEDTETIAILWRELNERYFPKTNPSKRSRQPFPRPPDI
jgi:hypothetical protein